MIKGKRCYYSFLYLVLLFLLLFVTLETTSSNVSARNYITDDNNEIQDDESQQEQQEQQLLVDNIDDGLYEPLQGDSDSCDHDIDKKTVDTGNSGDSDVDSDVDLDKNDSKNYNDPSCFQLPLSTIEMEEIIETTSTIDTKKKNYNTTIRQPETELAGITCSYGGNDPDDCINDDHQTQQECPTATTTTTTTMSSSSSNDNVPLVASNDTEKSKVFFDKHWGSDPTILRMRDRLRSTGSGESMMKRRTREQQQQQQGLDEKEDNNPNDEYHTTSSSSNENNSIVVNRRPPIFLMPGLASTRLVAWRFKHCLLSDIKVQDYVWLNLNLIMQMSTIDLDCLSECLKLGWNQSDTNDLSIGCKLRPDEGLDAISSLSPGGIGPQLLVGGTNTVYAWLIQWLADNLGYDVSSMVGLPYDWRLSPDKMETRDGFLTMTRRRIEASVQSNGGLPGIMVAHSMGNLIFRYFLHWLRSQLREEAYERYIKQSERKYMTTTSTTKLRNHRSSSGSYPGWTGGSTRNEVKGSESEDVPLSSEIPLSSEAESTESSFDKKQKDEKKRQQLLDLAVIEGDEAWYEWVEKHIWTYVGLSAPLLGAVNPVRSVISGESMGLPVANDAARWIEVTFGSTHTVNPVSTQQGFCDDWQNHNSWDDNDDSDSDMKQQQQHADSKLACIDDVLTQIDTATEQTKDGHNPFANFPALEKLLRYRANWDTDFPMIRVKTEYCMDKEKPPCAISNVTVDFGPLDVQNGEIFERFSKIWKEKDDPLIVKRDQLRESYWNTKVQNMLNETWDRPLIKHVVMAYGVDLPTEVGYEYRKTEKTKKKETKSDEKVHTNHHNHKRKKEDEFDGIPTLSAVVWETEGGQLLEERTVNHGLLGDLLTIKKTTKIPFKNGIFQRSGDGSVPYLSLAWAHTWLLHSARALTYSKQKSNGSSGSGNTDFFGKYGEDIVNTSNPLDAIQISHRPKGAHEWEDGPPPQRFIVTSLGEKKFEESSDTGTAHPHGTKYKPEMIRYHNRGTSRTTGIEYTTTIIEAIGVEHKETTRNYDILAAVFTNVLKCMHDDFNVV